MTTEFFIIFSFMRILFYIWPFPPFTIDET